MYVNATQRPVAATSSHLMMSSRAWATRVLIVEDHDLLAQSLLFALTAEGYDAALWPVARLDGLLGRPDQRVRTSYCSTWTTVALVVVQFP